ncbi:MAG: hypothetical protein ACKPKO_25520, partial [Candidatus Fonsibacter sp.]
SRVAARIASNPFIDVRKVIKDLIVQLMEEATSGTEHKGCCDTGPTTNERTRDRGTADVASLTAVIEDLTAHIQLTQDGRRLHWLDLRRG